MSVRIPKNDGDSIPAHPVLKNDGSQSDGIPQRTDAVEQQGDMQVASQARITVTTNGITEGLKKVFAAVFPNLTRPIRTREAG